MKPARTLYAALLLLTLLVPVSTGETTGAAAFQGQSEPRIPGIQPVAGGSGYQYKPLTAPNPVVQEMIEQVNEEALSQFIGSLSGEWPVDIGGEPLTLLTRNSFSGEPIQKSSEYLYDYYQDTGLPVAYQDFSLGEIALRNVIAGMDGSLFPDEISLITAHYDNAPSGPLAPGADDNASGTAAVMLAAGILSQYNFGCTIKFVNFSGEEQGLVGSKESARQSFCGRESIRSVLNLDMIGWNTPGSPAMMDLLVNQTVPGSHDLALLYQDVIETYSLDLTPEIIFSSLSGSDHASYWAYGFPSILAIEDLSDFNPNYHKTSDQLEFLDLTYMAEIARASLATLAHLSCLVDSGLGTVSGKVAAGPNGMPIQGATISFYHPEWDLSIKAISDEQGLYSRELAASTYFVSADAHGFSLEPIGLVSVAPGDANMQDVVLQPAQESVHFLPLAQYTTLNPACP
jgi:hypothetical protein